MYQITVQIHILTIIERAANLPVDVVVEPGGVVVELVVEVYPEQKQVS